jgi:hypothetical protein
VRTRPLRGFASLSFWLALVGTVLALVALVGCVVAIHEIVNGLGGNRIVMWIGFGVAAAGYVMLCAAAWRAHARSQLNRALAALPIFAPERAFFRARLVQQQGRPWRPSRRAALALREARSTGVVTWVDDRLAPLFAALPRQVQPLEPETVGSFMSTFETSFGTIALVVGSTQMLGRNWVAGVGWICIGAVFGVRLLMRGGLFEPVVAGQGWVQHGRSRWTVEDSMLVVTRQSWHMVHLTFSGPAGTLRLSLSSRDSQAAPLREFWQRWTHPAPRMAQQAFDA